MLHNYNGKMRRGEMYVCFEAGENRVGYVGKNFYLSNRKSVDKSLRWIHDFEKLYRKTQTQGHN